MKAFYSQKPKVLEAVGNGSYLYRYNITEEQTEATEQTEQTEQAEQTEQQTQWSCEEVTVWAPLSANKITEKVLTEKWDNNYEQKLVNEYNAAVMGMLSEDVAQKRKDAYMTFIQDRTILKTQIDNDCKEIGIK